MISQIDWEDFQKVHMQTGTILEVELNLKARIPAYILKIDFGVKHGIKTSSAQLTDLYTKEDLIGRQIVAVVNFEPKRIAGVKSEVLILGCPDDRKRVVLLHPDKPVANGEKVF